GTQALIPEVPMFAAAECDAVADIDLRRVDWKAGLVIQVGLIPIVVGPKRRINRRGVYRRTKRVLDGVVVAMETHDGACIDRPDYIAAHRPASPQGSAHRKERGTRGIAYLVVRVILGEAAEDLPFGADVVIRALGVIVILERIGYIGGEIICVRDAN